MSLIVLLLAACGWQATAKGDERMWPVGFSVAQVGELPRGNWIEHWPYDCVYTVTKTAEGLEVYFRNSDGYVHPHVRLSVTPTGVRAQASYGDCTSLWHGDNLAGTTCLVTDGKDATLQFELYEGGSEWVGRCLRGQAELGTPGVELAQRWSPPASDAQRHERFAYSCPGGFFNDSPTRTEFEVAGMIDALGQRQGLWVVRRARAGPGLRAEPAAEPLDRRGREARPLLGGGGVGGRGGRALTDRNGSYRLGVEVPLRPRGSRRNPRPPWRETSATVTCGA